MVNSKHPLIFGVLNQTTMTKSRIAELIRFHQEQIKRLETMASVSRISSPTIADDCQGIINTMADEYIAATKAHLNQLAWEEVP